MLETTVEKENSWEAEKDTREGKYDRSPSAARSEATLRVIILRRHALHQAGARCSTCVLPTGGLDQSPSRCWFSPHLSVTDSKVGSRVWPTLSCTFIPGFKMHSEFFFLSVDVSGFACKLKEPGANRLCCLKEEMQVCLLVPRKVITQTALRRSWFRFLGVKFRHFSSKN